MVAVAANRQIVRLKSGFSGRLVYWSTGSDSATVVVGGRHLRVSKDDILCIVQ